MKKQKLFAKLECIEQMLKENNLLQKKVLNFTEATNYLDVSPSCLYKMTSSGAIPFYKPNGKKLYFNRQELDQWLLRNKVSSQDELESNTENLLSKKRRNTQW
ncbi:MAG: helix-turn-helix domain-containing protein [Marinifilaceae bacterium]